MRVNLAPLCLVALLLGFASGCGRAPAPETTAAPEAPVAAVSESVPEPPPAPAPPPPVAAAPVPPVLEVPEDMDFTNVVIDLAAGETPVLEVQIYEIVTSDHTQREKAQELLALFPRLEPDLQRKVAMAAVRQVGDTNYEVLRDHLFDATLDPKVLNVFMSDMLKRTAPIKFPTLLDLARADGHPFQQTSSAQLRAELHADHGTNWTRWEKVVEMRLASEGN